MIEPGDVISHTEMCAAEDKNLQAGMHFRLHNGVSVVLMSRRANAPYRDRIENEGKTLIYEGHNISRRFHPEPDKADQPLCTPNGRPTQNGLFSKAAHAYKRTHFQPDLVRVYEKIMDGVWTYNGIFQLEDAWQEESNGRKVWKFRLELTDSVESSTDSTRHHDIEHNRIIPSTVKREVWKRDKGKCVKCGSTRNLHFDHDLPYSRGGASITTANIQLLCATCNLAKGNKIE